MFGSINVIDGNGLGSFTATAGTVISALVPGSVGRRTRITNVVYNSGSTQHTLTFLRPLGNTTTAQAQVATDTTIVLTAQPTPGNNVATNDYFAWKNTDGTYEFRKATGVATLTLTIAALVKDLPAGTTIYHLGITTDTDPRTGNAHPSIKPPVSATTSYLDGVVGVMANLASGEPILVQSDNGTAAGILTIQYAQTAR